MEARLLTRRSRDIDDELLDIFDAPNRSFPPIVFVKSDQGDMTAFRLLDLVEIFQEKVLVPIIDLCDEQDLFLNDDLDY